MKIILECQSEPSFSKCLDVASRITIGRQIPPKSLAEPTNGIFDARVLSRFHAELFMENGILYIKDLNSSNGTFVNNVSISNPAGKMGDPYALKNLDVIEFGVDIPDDDGNQVYKKVVCKLIMVDAIHESGTRELKGVDSPIGSPNNFVKLSNQEKLEEISNLLNQELKEIQDTKSLYAEFPMDSSLVESIDKLTRDQTDLKVYCDKRLGELVEKQDNFDSKLSQETKDLGKLALDLEKLEKKSLETSIELKKLKNQQDRRDSIQKYFIFGTILMSIGGILILKKFSIRE